VINPKHITWTAGNWNAYVESGQTRAERARRLAAVPNNLREEVEAHVRCAFAIRSGGGKRRQELERP